MTTKVKSNMRFSYTLLQNLRDDPAIASLSDGDAVSIQGVIEVGFGGGVYTYDASDTTSIDNIGTVVVVGSRRLKRNIDDSILRPEMFGAIPDYNHSLQTGSVSGAIINNTITAATSLKYNVELAGTDGTNGIGYGIETPILMKPLVWLSGAGDNTMLVQAADVPVIQAIFTGAGTDFIRMSKFQIQGGKTHGYTADTIVVERCHVPTTLEHLTVLDSGGTNIKIDTCTVVTLDQVWSNRPDNHCLHVDTFRSINVIGGAYEHSVNGHHIKIENTGEFQYPMINFTTLHTEGMLVNNISAVQLGGGANFDSVVSMGINGWQILGKNPAVTDIGNYGITLLNDRVSISLSNVARTGGTQLCDPTTFPAGSEIPEVDDFNVAFFSYYRNETSGKGIFKGKFGLKQDSFMSGVNKGNISIAAFTVTQQNVTIPDQDGADYDPLVTLEGFMGNNLTWYVDNLTDNTFRLNFVTISTGTLTQLSNPVKFHWSIVRND